MTTYPNFQVGGSTGSAAYNTPHTSIYEATVDFGTVPAASGDVYQLFSLPVGALVVAAGVEVVTATTGSGTIALGDGGSTGRFYAAAVPGSVGMKAVLVTNFPYLYTTADTVDLTIGTDTLTAGQVRVWALVVDASNKPGPTASWTP